MFTSRFGNPTEPSPPKVNYGGEDRSVNYPNTNSYTGGYNRDSKSNNKPTYQPPKEFEKLYLPYTMVANPDSTEEVTDLFADIATELAKRGYTVRTAGSSQDYPASKKLNMMDIPKETYVPLKGYDKQDLEMGNHKHIFSSPVAQDMMKYFDIYRDANPKSFYFKAIFANMVLGRGCNSWSNFIIVWSKDMAKTLRDVSKQTGAVAPAILLAGMGQKPLFNIADKYDLGMLGKLVESLPTNIIKRD